MRVRSLIAVGVLAFGCFVFVTLPASVVGSRAEGWTAGWLTLHEVTGSAWNGAARPAVSVPGSGAITPDQVTWSWKPLELFRGQVAFDIKMTMGKLTGTAIIARTPFAWEARDVSIQGPAAALAPLHPLLLTWQPTGSVAIESTFFRFDGRSFAGTARAEWRDATLALSPASPLGAWRIDVAADGGPAKVALSTQRGPLSLTGQGTLAVDGKLAFKGEARAEAEREADLASLLATIGPRRADGAHLFTLP